MASSSPLSAMMAGQVAAKELRSTPKPKETRPAKLEPVVEPAAPAEGTKPDQARVTLYLPKDVYRFIKRTALDFDCKPHDLLMQGVEAVLAKHGKKLSDFTS